jgi:hypothetical protein
MTLTVCLPLLGRIVGKNKKKEKKKKGKIYSINLYAHILCIRKILSYIISYKPRSWLMVKLAGSSYSRACGKMIIERVGL